MSLDWLRERQAKSRLASSPIVAAADFISGYADYADVLEAPRILHEIVGIQLVATILNRNGVTIPFGALKLSLDLWTVLISASGGGRNTVLGMTREVLDAAGLADLENSVRWGSAQALFQHFADKPWGLEVWAEMGERLKLLNQAGFETGKEWLTDRYDEFKLPATITYRATGKKSDTPPIQFGAAPRINIRGRVVLQQPDRIRLDGRFHSSLAADSPGTRAG
jgi:hypothetical protein